MRINNNYRKNQLNFYIMNTTIKNIVNTISNSFADSKWNDTVVFSSNVVLEQLEGNIEV